MSKQKPLRQNITVLLKLKKISCVDELKGKVELNLKCVHNELVYFGIRNLIFSIIYEHSIYSLRITLDLSTRPEFFANIFTVFILQDNVTNARR